MEREKDLNKRPVAFLGMVAIVLAVIFIEADPGVAAVWTWYYSAYQNPPDIVTIIRVFAEYFLLAAGVTSLLAATVLKRLRFRAIISTAIQALIR